MRVVVTPPSLWVTFLEPMTTQAFYFSPLLVGRLLSLTKEMLAPLGQRGPLEALLRAPSCKPWLYEEQTPAGSRAEPRKASTDHLMVYALLEEFRYTNDLLMELDKDSYERPLLSWNLLPR